MDPNADVETTSTSAMPVLLTPVQVGVAGAQTGDAYGRFATEVHGFLVRTVRDDDVAADILADAFTALLVEERGGRCLTSTLPMLAVMVTSAWWFAIE